MLRTAEIGSGSRPEGYVSGVSASRLIRCQEVSL